MWWINHACCRPAEAGHSLTWMLRRTAVRRSGTCPAEHPGLRTIMPPSSQPSVVAEPGAAGRHACTGVCALPTCRKRRGVGVAGISELRDGVVTGMCPPAGFAPSGTKPCGRGHSVVRQSSPPTAHEGANVGRIGGVGDEIVAIAQSPQIPRREESSRRPQLPWLAGDSRRLTPILAQ